MRRVVAPRHPGQAANRPDAGAARVPTQNRPAFHAVSEATGAGVTPVGARGRRGRLVRRMLMLADVLGLAVAFALAVLVFRSRVGPTDPLEWRYEVALFVVTLPGWLVLARLHGLYDRDEERASHSTFDDLVGVFQLVTVGAFLFFAASWLTKDVEPYPPKLFTFWLLAILFVALARAGARAFARTRPAYVQNAVVVGTDVVATLVARKIIDHPEFGVNVVGFIDPARPAGSEVIDGYFVLGSTESLADVVHAHDVDRVVVAFFDASIEDALDLVRRGRDLRVQIDVVPRLFPAVDARAQLHTLEGFPLIGLPPARLWRSSLSIKRALDVLVSGVGLLALLPLFAFIALRIKLESPGPILYRHERVGMNGRRFQLIKFRTMYLEHSAGENYGGAAAQRELERLLADPRVREEFERTHKLETDPRVTPFGRFLRRTSLDELPQFLNVLKGEMSLVGPRPVTEAELARYRSDVLTLLTFRPGVTGYWQINGRSRAVYEERVRLDMAYVRGWSLKLDFAVLGKTMQALVKGHGAY